MKAEIKNDQKQAKPNNKKQSVHKDQTIEQSKQQIGNETTVKQGQHKQQNITQQRQENIENENIKEDQYNIEQENDQINEVGQKDLNIKSNEQIQKQVKRWKKLNETLQKKRQIQFELFKKKLQFEKEKQEKQKRQKLQAEQEAKREEIKRRLEEIERRKQRRSQKMDDQKRSRVVYSEEKRQPLYQFKQKQYQIKKQLQQEEIKANIMKKKKQMMIDMDELREHEQKFINHLKQRFKSKDKLKKKKSKQALGSQKQSNVNQFAENNTLLKNNKSQFIIYPNSDPIKKQKDLQKYLRRKKFQQKLKNIPIIIDEDKMKQALIAKDKAKNPLKYNYLSNVAALSDQKIYEQFKDFEININQKQIGNQYMRKIHQKIPTASRIRSQSQSHLKPLAHLQPEPAREPYKNYMTDIKHLLKKRPQKTQPNGDDEVQQIMYRYQSNSDRLVELNRKSDYYQNEVLKKITQIRNTASTSPYSDYLGKQKVIDDLYMKSIKMKIATAKIM